MPALLILNYDVRDVAALMSYRAEATSMLIGPDRGTLLASTSETVSLPEGHAAGTHTVVLRFESVSAAIRIYESADYQRLVPQRLAATEPVVALIVPVLSGPGDRPGHRRSP